MFPRKAMVAFLLAGVALGGCAREVEVAVKLITVSCAAPAPLQDVTHIEIRVKGDGMEMRRLAAPVTAQAPWLLRVPPGMGRVVEARAYAGDPRAGGRLVSLGRSLPFTLPEAPPGQGPPDIPLFLRRVNAFTPPNLSDAPGACTHLLAARAAHSATVLQDGRVLIAGGFQLDASGQPVTLGSAEVYDMASGAFIPAADMTGPRAFHSATLLSSGEVLLAGGEVARQATALATALIYEPGAQRYRELSLAGPRSRHGAARDAGGRVLLAGGLRQAGELAGELEWFSPSPEKFNVASGDLLARAQVAVAPWHEGQYVAVAGGTDGVQLSDEVRLYEFTGTTFAASFGLRLQQPRRAAGITHLGDELLVVGGHGTSADDGGLLSVASTERLGMASGPAVLDGPTVNARGEACAVALLDGRVLVVGGRSDDIGFAHSEPLAELITRATSGTLVSLGMPPLPVTRYLHTCSALPDGTVLVLGGLQDDWGGTAALQDAWIFTPAPRD